MRTAKTGDQISDYLTTDVMNKLLAPGKLEAKQAKYSAPPNSVIFEAFSTSEIDTFEPVAITGPSIAPSTTSLQYDEGFQSVNCNVSTTLVNEKLAVVQGPLNSLQTAPCVALGLTWVKANVTSLAHTHLNVVAGALVSDTEGPCLIITPPGSTGVGYALVFINGAGRPVEIQTVLTAIQVTTNKVQYKSRNVISYYDTEETDWIDLPSGACEVIP